ncbi:unnamed protein product [Coregonus sp. 'balchen']|nr:unnamed protein product [Coregonus sp. 'balchen']
MLFLLLLNCAWGLLLTDDLEGAIEENKELGKAILEMLHINKLSAPHQAKPHPYMRQVYQLLDTQEARDLGSSDGTLVQSFRSVLGPLHAPAGWIWFNVSHLKPSMAVAELVLLRKTLHPNPLSVTVALHSLTRGASGLSVSPPLEERILTLDQLPLSGYDVFDVSPFMFSSKPLDVVGFQLRYTDESGSLVLHEALTQSLYCLGGGSLSEPLLVVYRARPLRHQTTAATNGLRPERRQRQHCRMRSHERRSLFLAKRNGYKRRRFDATPDPHGTCHIGNSGVSIEGFRTRKRQTEERSVNRSETDDVIVQKFRDARAESCICQPQAKH